MPKFHADGFKPVEADSAQAAAEIFATRQARRDYGRPGYCRTLRLDSWTQDGRSHTFQAFVGRTMRSDKHTTYGHNVWLYVSSVEA